MTAELHRVLAVTLDGTYYEAELPWAEAVARQVAHEDQRIAGRRPHVRYYLVRAKADTDPRWAHARQASWPFLGVVGSRGYGDDTDGPGRQSRAFTGPEKAARAAIHRRIPMEGRQGQGGWYYGSNGRPIAQGLTDLARWAQTRGWIAPSVKDGRWFPIVNPPTPEA